MQIFKKNIFIFLKKSIGLCGFFMLLKKQQMVSRVSRKIVIISNKNNAVGYGSRFKQIEYASTDS